ncbi:MAG: hypothetical protein L6R19_01975 [Alphaproteobacteria bacterium]|nr:hypothetical protein [Alphaproteobacteria bacterium]
MRSGHSAHKESVKTGPAAGLGGRQRRGPRRRQRLPPAAARAEQAGSVAEAAKARRAVRIAFGSAAAVAGFALAATAVAAFVIVARVLLYGAGHSHMRFYRDLFGALGLS